MLTFPSPTPLPQSSQGTCGVIQMLATCSWGEGAEQEPPSCADQGEIQPGKKEEGRDFSGLVTGKGPPMGVGGGNGEEGRALSASPTCRPQQAPFLWHSQPISRFSTLSPRSASLHRPTPPIEAAVPECLASFPPPSPVLPLVTIKPRVVSQGRAHPNQLIHHCFDETESCGWRGQTDCIGA